jgi:hypothetical protein
MSNDFQKQEAIRSNGIHPGMLDYAAARFAALAALAFAKFATRAAFRALLIFRLGFDGTSGSDGSDSPLIFAHLAFCAAAIFRLEAVENFLRLPVDTSGVAAASGEPPGKSVRSSAI